VKPDTIAKSLAIGNPADGFQVVKVVKETGGSGAMVTDAEILDAIDLLARTEGIFTEPAGGTTLAATRALVRRGVIKPNESVVVCITGNGYKTAEVMADRVERPIRIGRALADFERTWPALSKSSTFGLPFMAMAARARTTRSRPGWCMFWRVNRVTESLARLIVPNFSAAPERRLTPPR